MLTGHYYRLLLQILLLPLLLFLIYFFSFFLISLVLSGSCAVHRTLLPTSADFPPPPLPPPPPRPPLLFLLPINSVHSTSCMKTTGAEGADGDLNAACLSGNTCTDSSNHVCDTERSSSVCSEWTYMYSTTNYVEQSRNSKQVI